jgi:hypothetical protein
VKNQYFGDVNDYVKYGLLRFIAADSGLKAMLCWMLTPDDDRGDGGKLQYLREPGRWRHHDPELFDALQGMSLARMDRRSISLIEQTNLLPRTSFFSEILADDAFARRGYFDGLWRNAAGADFIFFDPDNGMEVDSVPLGRQGSSKYLYWCEARDTYRRGHSLVLFQHFPRVKRDHFIEFLANRTIQETGAAKVIALRSINAVFFLVPQPRHRQLVGRLTSGCPMATTVAVFLPKPD